VRATEWQFHQTKIARCELYRASFSWQKDLYSPSEAPIKPGDKKKESSYNEWWKKKILSKAVPIREEEGNQMSTKELQQEIISNMKRWQKVEFSSLASTGQIIEKTDNPVVRLVMEIIQRDSQMHYRIQEWIADSLEFKTVSLSPDELGKVWEMVERHIELEKKALEMAHQSLEALKGKRMVIQEYLLEYLAEDEEKHNNLLRHLEIIKKGMRPS
jgi:hypothetical protein